jgi:hypothetical protein
MLPELNLKTKSTKFKCGSNQGWLEQICAQRQLRLWLRAVSRVFRHLSTLFLCWVYRHKSFFELSFCQLIKATTSSRPHEIQNSLQKFKAACFQSSIGFVLAKRLQHILYTPARYTEFNIPIAPYKGTTVQLHVLLTVTSHITKQFLYYPYL